MKFKANRKALVSALGLALRACEKRNLIPILSRFLFAANGDLTIAATDLEIGITSHVEADVKTEGAAALPAKTLVDYLSALDTETVDVSVSETGWASVVSGRNRIKVASLTAESFPTLPTQAEDGVLVKASDLAEMLKRVAFVPEIEHSGISYRSAVFLDFHKDSLVCVAMAGHRMSQCSMACANNHPATMIAISKRAATELMAACAADTEAQCELSWDENHLFAKAGAVVFIARRLALVTPSYYAAGEAERKLKHSCSVSAADLKGLASRSAIFATQLTNRSRLLTLTVKKDSVTIASAKEDGESEQACSAVADGEAIIGLNATYLLDPLGVIGDEQLTLEYSDGNTVIRMYAASDRYETRHIVMPMKI